VDAIQILLVLLVGTVVMGHVEVQVIPSIMVLVKTMEHAVRIVPQTEDATRHVHIVPVVHVPQVRLVEAQGIKKSVLLLTLIVLVIVPSPKQAIIIVMLGRHPALPVTVVTIKHVRLIVTTMNLILHLLHLPS
jgi:hypothetical protein